MKTVLHLLSFYLGLILTTSSLISCEPKELADEKQRFALPGEDIINLEPNAVPESDGKDQIQLFVDSTALKSGGDIEPLAELIKIDAFTLLRDNAAKISSADSNFILALRIMYGLNLNTKRMNLLYEPLFLKKTPTSPQKINAEYMTLRGPYIYKYDKATSKFKTTTDMSGLQVYKDNIQIKRTGLGFGEFYLSNDSTGDVKEVVFSFQEIDSLIHGNPKTANIKILNAAETMYINQKKYTKHILLLGPDDLFPAVPIFFMKFGNLSHLCPPSCGATPYKYNLK